MEKYFQSYLRATNVKETNVQSKSAFDPKFNALSSVDYSQFSNHFRSLFKVDSKDPAHRFDEHVFKSLQWYEKSTSLLKGQLKLVQFQQSRELKSRVFEKIALQAKSIPLPSEPLTEEETAQFKLLAANPTHARELAELIEQKMENERREQEEFLETVRAQIYEDQIAQLQGATEIARILQRKVVGKYIPGFNAITGSRQADKPQLNPVVLKNVFLGLSILINAKIKEKKESAFRTIVNSYAGINSSVDKMSSDLKFKGKMLMGLKEYPRLNLKRAFWRWYLMSTGSGENLFQRAADNLVLYTNINKTTSFYRLFSKIKGRKRKVHPRVKRMTVMLYLYSRIFVERNMRDFFEKIKVKGGSVKVKATEKLIQCADKRRNQAFRTWVKKMKEMRVQGEKDERIRKIQESFLKRLMMTKIGKTLQGWQNWKNLPERKDNAAFLKASKFEKGLSSFVDRTLKRSFGAFKNELEEGQAFKKRAVIQLLNVTMGGQKKFYNRWLSITEKTKLLNECKLVSSVFASLNFAIKSVADIAFVDNKDTAIKEKALIQLFKNLSANVGDCFKRWRDVNNIEKLRERMSNQQKEGVLKVLANLLNNGKTAQIREAINKFRLNRRITEIQRNFLKRLLMSKAGLVVIGFKKWQGLPERKDNAAFLKASKFEKGLSSFVDRTLKRSFGAFKNELEEGQAFKKRAVIQLLNVTMGGQKKFYNRWLQTVQNDLLYKRCKAVALLFQHCQTSVDAVVSPILNKKQYTLSQVKQLQNFFSKVSNANISNAKNTLATLRANAQQERVNPWFKKSATILALNTKINIQKSFWRLKYNMDSSGVQYNAAVIVKLKKLYNNIRKQYELNLFRAFLMIDKYGRSNDKSTGKPSNSKAIAEAPKPAAPIPAPQPVVQQESNSKYEAVLAINKKASLSIIDRVFRRNFTKQVKKWQFNAHPEKKLEFVHNEITKKSKDEYEYVAKYGALEVVNKISTTSNYKAKAKAFRCILETMFKKKIDHDYDASLEQRLELINRQNALMEEIRTYKEENEALSHQVETKEKVLKESNETVSILSLRINYMITQKFLIMMEKVWESVEYRHLNDAFDALIDAANENYELHEGGMLEDQE